MNQEAGKKSLWKLFFHMFYISAFTFGGGFVIVTIMREKFVEELHWIEEQEMMDLIALAQSAPGAVAVNAAILVGWKTAALKGMFTAALATVLPPLIILSVISWFYSLFISNPVVALILEGMQAGVAAVILNAAYDLAMVQMKSGTVIYPLIMIGAFIASFFFGVNVVCIILGAGAVGILLHLFGKEGEED